MSMRFEALARVAAEVYLPERDGLRPSLVTNSMAFESALSTSKRAKRSPLLTGGQERKRNALDS